MWKFVRLYSKLLVNLTLAAVTAIVWSAAFASVSTASHVRNPHHHIASLHDGGWDEEICADSLTTSFTDFDVASRVMGTLWSDNPSQSYDNRYPDPNAGNWPRIWFKFRQSMSIPCGDYGADLQNVETKFYAVDTSETNCWGYPVSCAHLDDPVPAYTFGWEQTHTEYMRSRVYLRTSHLVGAAWNSSTIYGYHHLINHEFGHVLGFKDPKDPDLGSPDPCPAEPGSVMHSKYYKCVNREYPTSNDLTALKYTVDSATFWVGIN